MVLSTLKLAIIFGCFFQLALFPYTVLGDDTVISAPQLTVRGEALLQVPADQLRLAIGVVSTALEADEVVRINSRIMAEVERALQRAGLSGAEYQTGRFQVRSNWSSRPKIAGDDWQTEIDGFTATNIFQVTTGQFSLAGKIIGMAAEAGANDIRAIQFGLADPRTHREAAIRQATENALADAQVLADAAKVRLVRVLSLLLDDAGARPQIMQAEGYGMLSSRAMPDAQPIIAPGEVEVRANMTLVYEIAPKN
nr:SIMPL domain-containing protein [Desulfobulbaceae bacterium]